MIQALYQALQISVSLAGSLAGKDTGICLAVLCTVVTCLIISRAPIYSIDEDAHGSRHLLCLVLVSCLT